MQCRKRAFPRRLLLRNPMDSPVAQLSKLLSAQKTVFFWTMDLLSLPPSHTDILFLTALFLLVLFWSNLGATCFFHGEIRAPGWRWPLLPHSMITSLFSARMEPWFSSWAFPCPTDGPYIHSFPGITLRWRAKQEEQFLHQRPWRLCCTDKHPDSA